MPDFSLSFILSHPTSKYNQIFLASLCHTSYTFVTILTYVGGTYGYGAVVAASVVTTMRYSLLTVGIRSFGGGYTEDFGSPKNLLLGSVTLIACLLFNIFAKSFWKQLSVLFGLIVGYILAAFMGVVDFSGILDLLLPKDMEIHQV